MGKMPIGSQVNIHLCTKYGFCGNISEFTYFLWTILSISQMMFWQNRGKTFYMKINVLLGFTILCQHTINYIEQFGWIFLSENKLFVVRIAGFLPLVGGLEVDVDGEVKVVHRHAGGSCLSMGFALRIIFFTGRTFISSISTTLVSVVGFPKTSCFMFGHLKRNLSNQWNQSVFSLW